MPTYVYETITDSTSIAPQRFEVRQSMTEPALTRHPETGAPVRRVITGGTGLMGGSSSSPAARPSSGVG